MSATAIAVSGSNPRRTGTQPATTQAQSEQDIANLAYALWQQRGCPEGSPEQDWIEAERSVRNEPQSTPDQPTPASVS